MITSIFIVIFLILTSLITHLYRDHLKKSISDKKEIEKKILPIANSLLVFFFIGIIFINFSGFFKTQEEINDEKDAALLEKIESNRLSEQEAIDKLQQKTDDSIAKLPFEKLVQSVYKNMNEDIGGFKRPPNVSKENLLSLMPKAKNTKYEKIIKKSIDSLDTVMNKNILENESIERKEYETTLRNNFLDNNLNIRVKVFGINYTKITLSYPLFNEVWFRKFQKEGHFDKLAQKGFKKITLTDNYDYNQWITYN